MESTRCPLLVPPAAPTRRLLPGFEIPLPLLLEGAPALAELTGCSSPAFLSGLHAVTFN